MVYKPLRKFVMHNLHNLLCLGSQKNHKILEFGKFGKIVKKRKYSQLGLGFLLLCRLNALPYFLQSVPCWLTILSQEDLQPFILSVTTIG